MDEKENIYGYQESLIKKCKTESETRECKTYKHNINKGLTAENNEFTMYFNAYVNENSSIDKIENAGIHSINAGPQKSHIVMDTNVKGENEVRLVMLQFAQKDIKNIDFYKQCADDITPPEPGQPSEPSKPETPEENNEECCEELVVKMYILASPKKVSCEDYLVESDNLKKQITELQNKVNNLNKEIENVDNTQVEELKKGLSKIEEELKDLQSRKTELDNQFSECDAHAGLEPDETEETKTTTSETTVEPTKPSKIQPSNTEALQTKVTAKAEKNLKPFGENGEPKVTEETIEEPVNEVVQVGIKEVKQEVRQEEIPAPEKHQDSDELYEGETKVIQEGKPGKKETTFEVTYIKGEAKDSKIIKEEIAEEPEAKIILVGTKKIDFSELIELVQEEPQINTSIEYKHSPKDVQKEYDTAIQKGKDILDNKDNTSQEEVDKAVDDIKKAKDKLKAQPNIIEEEITVEEEIDFDIVRRDDSELDKGKTEVAQKGEKGTKKLVYKVTYEDGEEISRELVSEEVIKEAKDEIILVGTKDVPAKPPEEQPSQRDDKVTAKVEQNLKPFGETGAGAFGLASGLGLISVALSGAVVRRNNCKVKKNKKED